MNQSRSMVRFGLVGSLAGVLVAASLVLGGCYEKEIRSSGLGSAGRSHTPSGEGNTYRTLGPKDSDPRPGARDHAW